MTAGEHEAQLIVGDGVFVVGGEIVHSSVLQVEFREARGASHAVDRTKASGRYEPAARIARHSFCWPSLERGGERVLHRLLGAIEITEETNQAGQDPTRFRAIDGLDRVARHRTQPIGDEMGRTSTLPVRTDGMREAI